jgi:hypothetical protein
LEVNRLHVAGRAFQHHVDIGLGGVVLASRQFQAGAVQAALHDAGLIGDQLIQNGDRPRDIAFQPQQLRLGEQGLRRFRLRGNCPVDFQLGARKVGARNREPGIGQKWLNGVR